MPKKTTQDRARRAKRQGKAPTTQAGEFVQDELHHVREGEHGAKSSEQAIAIGLNKARRAGVEVGSPKSGPKRSRRASSSRPGRSPAKRSAASKKAPPRRARRGPSRRKSPGASRRRATR